MVEKVGYLINSLLLIPVLGGDNSLGTLLAHLFQYLIQSLIEKIAGIGALGGVLLSVYYRGVKSIKCVHYSSSISILRKKQLRSPVWQVGPSGRQI